MPLHESSAFPDNLPDAKLLPAPEIDEILTTVQNSHTFSYKLINLDVWALVETLDGVFPGAWGQFMTNRQLAVKQFWSAIAILLRVRLMTLGRRGGVRWKSSSLKKPEVRSQGVRSQELETSRKKNRSRFSSNYPHLVLFLCIEV